MSRPRVCVVGSLHFDIIVRAPRLPRLGETLIGETWSWKPGGKGANQAMAAARHGAEVELIGCLGDDDDATRLRERIAAAGVGVSHVRTVPQGSGMSVAIQQAGGDYAAVVVSGANGALDPAQVAGCGDALGACRVLVLQNEVAAHANAAAARLAREAGATVILNAAPARPLEGLAGLIDVLVVNAVEAEMLGAAPVGDLGSATEAADHLRDVAPAVIVTAGAAGLAAASDSGTLSLTAHPVARPQTHGAGDAFVGALAARLAAGDPHSDALGYANAAAALHVGRREADRDALAPADVQRLLADVPATTAG